MILHWNICHHHHFKKILFENIPNGCVVVVDFVDNQVVFDVQANALAVLPTIDSNGYIVLDQVES
jgi:hypothetical protein